MNNPLSKETAELARKKGYKGELSINDLATWMGRMKNVYVVPTSISQWPPYGYTVHVFNTDKQVYERVFDKPELFETAVEAFDKGLRKGLELI